MIAWLERAGVVAMSSLSAGALPLDQKQTDSLQVAVSGLTPEQLQWVSGYAAGLAAANGPANRQSTSVQSTSVAAVESTGEQSLTVLYGSQTGNGEDIALSLVDQARATGFAAKAVSLADYKPAHLKRESLVTFVISTHGEGDPPDDAELFHEFLLSKKAPKLSTLKFSVLALGDSSYVNFCQTGRDFDTRLAELGGERIAALLECDLDYDSDALVWTKQLVSELPDLIGEREAVAVPRLRAVETEAVFDKSNPFPAEVLVNQKITGAASSKDVRHIELSLEGSGLRYEPGDAVAVVAHNPPQLVAEVLEELALAGDEIVSVCDEEIELDNALTTALEITVVSLGFLRDWAALAGDENLSSILDQSNPKVLGDFVENHQVIDVVRLYPAKVEAQQFAGMLRVLSPRSYSIASSPEANPDEVHLTVAAVHYEAFGREHWGSASTHLLNLAEGESASVFVDRHSRFRLPGDDVPMIMIGPGTGVAPFRAFVEQRVEQGATGDNWLFFGDRNFDSDFLYQLEWQRHLKQGNLTRLDVAFSRDQSRKIYVQDRIRENSEDVYRWIERGAAIYVCGDAKNMANDVNDALIDVLAREGGLNTDSAARKLKALRSEGRYQRDVY
jgi:sulfite reductase (NADPH) flavoprotein alpha-component